MNQEQIQNLRLKTLLIEAKNEIVHQGTKLQLLRNNNLTSKFIDEEIKMDIVQKIDAMLNECTFTEVNFFVCEACPAFGKNDVLIPLEAGEPYIPYKVNDDLYIKADRGCPYCFNKSLKVLLVGNTKIIGMLTDLVNKPEEQNDTVERESS